MVSLTVNAVSGGDFQGDTISGMEDAIGTNYNDSPAGSADPTSSIVDDFQCFP